MDSQPLLSHLILDGHCHNRSLLSVPITKDTVYGRLESRGPLDEALTPDLTSDWS